MSICKEGGRGNADHADKYGGHGRDAMVERGRVALSVGSRGAGGFGAGGTL